MKINLLCLFLFCQGLVFSQNETPVGLVPIFSSINMDSLYREGGDIEIMDKNIIDSEWVFFPIFLKENGWLQLLTYKILKNENSNFRKYKLRFQIKLDTAHSALAINNFSIRGYDTNHFNIDNSAIELHNDIYFEDLLKVRPCFSKEFQVNHSGDWNDVEIWIENEASKKMKYIQLGISTSNEKTTKKLIKACSHLEEPIQNILLKLTEKNSLKGYHLLKGSNASNSNSPKIELCSPQYLLRNIELKGY